MASVQAQQPAFGGIQLGAAAHRRGHDVRFTALDDLSLLDDGTVVATTTRPKPADHVRSVDFHRALVAPDAISEEEPLDAFDVLIIRFAPGFEGAAISGAPALDLCWRLRHSRILVVNDPEGLRRAAGGHYLASLPAEVRARTLVSRSPSKIKAFLKTLDTPSVLKPLTSGGATRVFYLRRRQVANVNSIISAITRTGYAVAQEYLPGAEEGEKRVFLLDGRPLRLGDGVAAYGRIPALRNNFLPPKNAATTRAPGRRRSTKFTATDERLCELLRPRLLADGLYMASVDIVGDRILALDVFTPRGLHALRELTRVDVPDVVIRDLERRVRLQGDQIRGFT